MAVAGREAGVDPLISAESLLELSSPLVSDAEMPGHE